VPLTQQPNLFFSYTKHYKEKKKKLCYFKLFQLFLLILPLSLLKERRRGGTIPPTPRFISLLRRGRRRPLIELWWVTFSYFLRLHVSVFVFLFDDSGLTDNALFCLKALFSSILYR